MWCCRKWPLHYWMAQLSPSPALWGEFGAVIFIAGNIAWKMEVASPMIFVRLQEFDYPAASAIASVILAVSLLLLFSINVFQSRFGQRTRKLVANISAFNTVERPSINWAKWSLIVIDLLFSVLLLVVPMVSIFAEVFSNGIGVIWSNLIDPDMLHAI